LKKKYHIIAMGGAVMHNLSVALHQLGHEVAGSDDEIYEPAKSRLAKAKILPKEFGWFPEKLTTDIDCVILGMHARKDNPELLKAQELNLNIKSFPEFIYEHSKDKMRIVVAGSHGKTTTTSMIMHALKLANIDFDYLVGAQLKGFETMVRLSDAPIMIIEGDEYLSSPLDLRSKMLHYKPHIAIITGIAWDHINVFPTIESYLSTFKTFVESLSANSTLIYYKDDSQLQELVKLKATNLIPYEELPRSCYRGSCEIIYALPVEPNSKLTHFIRRTKPKVIGKHNRENFAAAWWVVKELGVTPEQFKEVILTFEGAAKRLQVIAKLGKDKVYLDFAHAPSKVKATVDAVKDEINPKPLVACLELHTFSSLNKEFLPEYKGTLNSAQKAIVFFNEHTLNMKKMPLLSEKEVADAFQHKDLIVFTDQTKLSEHLTSLGTHSYRYLFMTSGNFNGLDLKKVLTQSSF
jgi:UDP-N-acetylmuramate: L-alanyl-gamma-D-glutamyl-meso-diaminopimelate ligase